MHVRYTVILIYVYTPLSGESCGFWQNCAEDTSNASVSSSSPSSSSSSSSSWSSWPIQLVQRSKDGKVGKAGKYNSTLPETNSSPLKIHPWKRRFLLETTIFRCELLVSGREKNTDNTVILYLLVRNLQVFLGGLIIFICCDWSEGRSVGAFSGLWSSIVIGPG